MYYTPLVQAPHETGTAVAEPFNAVRTTAEVQHRRVERGVDNFRTTEGEELSEKAERLNDRLCDMEQEARSDLHNLAVVRHTTSRERAAFKEKNKPVPIQAPEAAIRHPWRTCIPICAKQPAYPIAALGHTLLFTR